VINICVSDILLLFLECPDKVCAYINVIMSGHVCLQISVGNVGEVYKIRLAHDNSGDFPGWLCDEVMNLIYCVRACPGSVVVDMHVFTRFIGHNIATQLSKITPDRYRFVSDHGLWILSYEEGIQLACETPVVLFRCWFQPDIMHGGAPEVFPNKAGKLG
jgi:hypothetical protein